MHARPMISASVTTGLIESIRAAGVRAEELLRKMGLDTSLLLQPEGFLPCSVVAQALEEAARASSDDCFGLHFGERFNPKNIGPLVYAVVNAPTTGAAFELEDATFTSITKPRASRFLSTEISPTCATRCRAHRFRNRVNSTNAR
jgi:Arabinose-binding domain of AraC transcription regulator, N-term